jgi:putative methyltransferase
VGDRDWLLWHDQYDDPGSSLSWRLRIIQQRIREYLDSSPAGTIRTISLCAGQGRDIVGALADHPRRGDVLARLVEVDPRNVAHAERLLAETDLAGVEVVQGDASSTSAYVGAVPAELVLACGVLGNLRDDDVENTIVNLPSLCAEGATVIWTRHRLHPDLTPTVRRWFAGAGFVEVAFDTSPEGPEAVGVHRLARAPSPFRDGVKLFEFIGYDKLMGS